MIVLTGSLGTDHSMWEPQAQALGRRFRVLRWDIRGHGASPVPPGPYTIADLGGDLLRLLDELDVDRAHLCGLSIGAMISLWVAAHAPERVERLVACCTPAHFGAEATETYRERAARVREGGLEPIADAVLERWVTPAYAARCPETVTRLRAGLTATPAEGYAACCEALATMDLRADLPGIRAPALVLAGAQDTATPPDHGRGIADAIPGAEFLELPQAAHLASVERPGLVTALLLRFLDPSPGVASSGHLEQGMLTRRAVLGDEHVDRASVAAGEFGAPFQEFITAYAWGAVWSRPGLDRRLRSAITLAALVSLRAENELAMHVRAAVGNGLSPDEIREVILHTAVYAGVPAANAAFAIAKRVLEEAGELG